jgi:hypothetical protein
MQKTVLRRDKSLMNEEERLIQFYKSGKLYFTRNRDGTAGALVCGIHGPTELELKMT